MVNSNIVNAASSVRALERVPRSSHNADSRLSLMFASKFAPLWGKFNRKRSQPLADIGPSPAKSWVRLYKETLMRSTGGGRITMA